MLTVHPLPAFDDNYIWLVEQQGQAVVVDPGQAPQVSGFLADHGLTLAAALVTHRHSDHTGGV
ncbi:MAG TPA: MBL fold metallo-hydrolase, partial [Gammaproteobacteria bacterium]|nr:MBL fold metallo-hydrolase [Gammaproteobacteria bacterium]